MLSRHWYEAISVGHSTEAIEWNFGLRSSQTASDTDSIVSEVVLGSRALDDDDKS